MSNLTSNARVLELWGVLLLKVEAGSEPLVVREIQRNLSRTGISNTVYKCFGYYDLATIGTFGEIESMRRLFLSSQAGSRIHDIQMLSAYQLGEMSQDMQLLPSPAPLLVLTEIELAVRLKRQRGLGAEIEAAGQVSQMMTGKGCDVTVLGGFGPDLLALQRGDHLKSMIDNVLELQRIDSVKRTTSLVMVSWEAILDDSVADADPTGWNRHIEVHLRAVYGGERALVGKCVEFVEGMRKAYEGNVDRSLGSVEDLRHRFGVLYEVGERDYALILHGEICAMARGVLALRNEECCEQADTTTAIYQRLYSTDEVGRTPSDWSEVQKVRKPLLNSYRQIHEQLSQFDRSEVEKIEDENVWVLTFDEYDGDTRELLEECSRTLDYALRRAASSESHPLGYFLQCYLLVELAGEVLRIAQFQPSDDEDYFAMRNRRQVLLTSLGALRFGLQQRHSETSVLNTMGSEPASTETTGGAQKVLLGIDWLMHDVMAFVGSAGKRVSVVAGWRHVPEYVGDGVVNLQRTKLLFPEDWTPLFHECGHAWIEGNGYPDDNDAEAVMAMATQTDPTSGRVYVDWMRHQAAAKESEQILADLFSFYVGFGGDHDAYERCLWKHITPRVDMARISANAAHYALRGFILWLTSRHERLPRLLEARALVPQYLRHLKRQLDDDISPVCQLSGSGLKELQENVEKLVVDTYALVCLHVNTIREILGDRTRRPSESTEKRLLQLLSSGEVGGVIDLVEAGSARLSDVVAVHAKDNAMSDQVAKYVLGPEANRQRATVVLACYHFALRGWTSLRGAEDPAKSS